MSMSDDGQRMRHILPQSLASSASTVKLQESSEAKGLAPGQFSSPVSTSASGSGRSATNSSSRTNIRSACLACRRRRNRCSGGHPCSRCRALETECVYDESQDGRTRALRERGKEELDLHRRIIDGVFRAVRVGNQQRLFELIRNNASLATIAIAIEESNTESPSGTPVEGSGNQLFSGREQSEDKSMISQWTYSRSATLSAELTDPRMASQYAGYYASDTAGSSSTTGAFSHAQTLGAGVTLTEIRHMLQPLHPGDAPSLEDSSSIYTNFQRAAAQMIKQGILIDNVLGSPGALCILRAAPEKSPLDVFSWATIVVSEVSGVDFLFRLAWLCYITRFVTWTIHPSLENFNRVPPAMRPTTMQLTIPHQPIIDLVPLPQIRDRMIHNFRDFKLALRTAGASIYWTDSVDEAIIENPVTKDLTVTAKFERHIDDINNFYFGRNMLNVFPELNGQFEIAEVDQVMGFSSSTSPATSPMDQ